MTARLNHAAVRARARPSEKPAERAVGLEPSALLRRQARRIMDLRGSAMSEPRNRVVQIKRFGGAEGWEGGDAALPTAGRGEVRVRVLAPSVEYTDVVLRFNAYLQPMPRRPPFVMGYDV